MSSKSEIPFTTDTVSVRVCVSVRASALLFGRGEVAWTRSQFLSHPSHSRPAAVVRAGLTVYGALGYVVRGALVQT